MPILNYHWIPAVWNICASDHPYTVGYYHNIIIYCTILILVLTNCVAIEICNPYFNGCCKYTCTEANVPPQLISEYIARKLLEQAQILNCNLGLQGVSIITAIAS